MTKFGYARVSTRDQSLDLQIDALAAAGVAADNIYSDRITGSAKSRPGLDALLGVLAPGDQLTIWRLDRLGRSISHIVKLVEDFRERDIALKSVSDGIDTSSGTVGMLVLHVLAAVSEMEREVTRERVIAGLEASKRRGIISGRRPSLNADRKSLMATMLREGKTHAQIARAFDISTRTVTRYVAQANEGNL